MSYPSGITLPMSLLSKSGTQPARAYARSGAAITSWLELVTDVLALPCGVPPGRSQPVDPA
jgi:hypothetical protein